MLSEDIINYEFSRTFKGYDITQVEEYIENIISMYEQLANENKEISARFEQLAASFEENRKTVEEAENLYKEKDRIVSEANAERDSILSEAREEALKIKQEANEKAAECVEKAESMARRLLTEAKNRADVIDAECAEIKLAAEKEAKATLDAALLEAKALIRATKLKNQERIEQAEAQIDVIKEEHDRIARAAADFKSVLYEVYSEQLIKIEGIEIPQFCLSQEPAETAQEEPSDKECETPCEANASDELPPIDAPSQEAEQASEPVTQKDESEFGIPDTSESQPEPSAETELTAEPDTDENAEKTYIFGTDLSPTPQGSSNLSASAKKEKYKPSIYAGIEVQKEHSGQIRYDSKDIGSVNQTIDSILEKKGKTAQNQERATASKLGFLK